MRPNALSQLISVVWDCLLDMQDDLSASTGAVMDLLAILCSHTQILEAMRVNAADDPDQITVVAFDALLDEHTGAAVCGWDDPEQAFACNEQQKVLRRLIRELPEPSRTIVNGLHFQGRHHRLQLSQFLSSAIALLNILGASRGFYKSTNLVTRSF